MGAKTLACPKELSTLTITIYITQSKEAKEREEGKDYLNNEEDDGGVVVENSAMLLSATSSCNLSFPRMMMEEVNGKMAHLFAPKV